MTDHTPQRQLFSPGASSSLAALNTDASRPCSPYFFPSLMLQRRAFCLNVLKAEGVKSVSEIGCGDGGLLSALCEPAQHIDDFSDILPRKEDDTSSDEDGATEDIDQAILERRRQARLKGKRATKIANILSNVPHPPANLTDLHVRRCVAVDIDKKALDQAASFTAAPSPHSTSEFIPDRWEDLHMELWHGSLVQYNDHLDDTEIVIASEVVEHLSDKVLEKFIQMVFQVYRPRLVLITTPNYDFNQYFQKCKSNHDIEYKKGFRDPTGRTDRTFRDSDHKFEWTAQEFKQWCNYVTSKTEYDYTISGVGSLRQYLRNGYKKAARAINKSQQQTGINGVSSTSSSTSSLNTDTIHSVENSSASSSPDSSSPQSHPDMSISPDVSIQENYEPSDDIVEMYATQTAIFRRKYSQEPERSPRSPKTVSLPFLSKTSNGIHTTDNVHSLVSCSFHPAVNEAGKPASFRRIRHTMRAIFENQQQYERSDTINLQQLWTYNPSLRRVCGGYLGKIIEAIVDDVAEEWEVVVDDSEKSESNESRTGAWCIGVKSLVPLNTEQPSHENHMNIDSSGPSGSDLESQMSDLQVDDDW